MNPSVNPFVQVFAKLAEQIAVLIDQRIQLKMNELRLPIPLMNAQSLSDAKQLELSGFQMNQMQTKMSEMELQLSKLQLQLNTLSESVIFYSNANAFKNHRGTLLAPVENIHGKKVAAMVEFPQNYNEFMELEESTIIDILQYYGLPADAEIVENVFSLQSFIVGKNQ